MDYSTWLNSASLNLTNNANTLRLFDDEPVKDVKPSNVNPPTSNEVASKLWLKDETGALLEELNRVNAENKRLTEMLTLVCENYNDLKRQLMEYMNKNSSNNESNKKRKVENTSNNNGHNNSAVNNAIVARNNVESTSSDEEDSYGKQKGETIKAKITTVSVRTEASDSSLILKDRYQWRKYGQKVTRDNPCPRAYFKCSFAPSCPVKKKVQRSLEDQSMLVATYEGDHNHPAPAQPEGPSPSSRSFTPGSGTCNASAPTVTLDLTNSKPNVNTNASTITTNNSSSNNNNNKMLSDNNNNNKTSSSQMHKFSSPEFQKLLAEQMASSLTKDPNFTAALAAAITGRFTQQNSSD